MKYRHMLASKRRHKGISKAIESLMLLLTMQQSRQLLIVMLKLSTTMSVHSTTHQSQSASLGLKMPPSNIRQQ